ncbi:hypothetical protein BHE90_012781 [Fusarium euwallaceae]|uniref:Uncharacterized protein n=1 Tax=Fusarium euwallaceae TaxID=1147111 RepID=A0A430LAM6_9HYPO|nr:hypothetical protein BHE90_012781 [Fusarium euwallaceae]
MLRRKPATNGVTHPAVSARIFREPYGCPVISTQADHIGLGCSYLDLNLSFLKVPASLQSKTDSLSRLNRYRADTQISSGLCPSLYCLQFKGRCYPPPRALSLGK